MDQVQQQFIDGRVAPRARLTTRRVDRTHDLPHQHRIVTQGKRQDIRRIVVAQVPRIETLNRAVTHEDDRQFDRRPGASMPQRPHAAGVTMESHPAPGHTYILSRQRHRDGGRVAGQSSDADAPDELSASRRSSSS